MVEKKILTKKLSTKTTKQEMLDAYNELAKQLQERDENELKPEKKIEEKKIKEVVEAADSLSSEGVVNGISSLKLEIGKMLTQISDRLEEEVNKFRGINKAIEIKEAELKEVYEIERSAATLAALIESQNQKHREFESEMDKRKEDLNNETQAVKSVWEKEKKEHDIMSKEREDADIKSRKREREEYVYAFEREKQLAKDKFEDEKAKLERETQLQKEQMEKELTEREKTIAENEDELNELRKKVGAFPKEMETDLNKAIKETTETIRKEAKNNEELLKKEIDGERNVLNTKIGSLEKTVKEQSDQINRLSQQLEKAYQKVQDIAVKAVEGSSSVRPLANLEQIMTEQARKQAQEK
jgi:hypothetical protein